MKTLSKILFAGVWAVVLAAGTATAQTETDLRDFFEGRKVEVLIDMPASRGGVNVYPERRQPLDLGHYRDLLRKYGAGVTEGERIMVTKIRVKKKHIEFQLGGGGYGGWSDETSPDVYVPAAAKTEREKNLERDLKKETDERRRREIREELGRLRQRREREDARNRAQAAAAEELARQRIRDQRRQAGSRFNIRFERQVEDRDLTPARVLAALAAYIELID